MLRRSSSLVELVLRSSQPPPNIVDVRNRRAESNESDASVEALHPRDDDFEGGASFLVKDVDFVDEEEGDVGEELGAS